MTINGGTLTKSVYGGQYDGGTGPANVSEKSVIINNGTLSAYVYGGANSQGSATVTKNSVTMIDGTVAQGLYGAVGNTGEVSDNTLEIKGGKVSGVIYAAFGSGDVKNNSLIISGTPDLSEASINGGYTSTGTSSGNALHLKTSNLTVKNLRYFQALNFYVPEGFNASTESMLTIDTGGTADISNATINVGLQGKSWKKGFCGRRYGSMRSSSTHKPICFKYSRTSSYYEDEVRFFMPFSAGLLGSRPEAIYPGSFHQQLFSGQWIGADFLD